MLEKKKIYVTFSEASFNEAKKQKMPNIRLDNLSYEAFKNCIPTNEIDSNVLLKFYAETNLVIRHTIIDRCGNGVHFDMFGAFPVDGSMLPYSGLYGDANAISETNRICDISIVEVCDSIEANEDFDAYIVCSGEKKRKIEVKNTDCDYKIV